MTPEQQLKLITTRTAQDPRTPGHTRQPKPSHCPQCQAPTLTCLDDDVAALTIHVDPHPLTPTSELQAHLTGRHTYTLTHRRNHQQLDQRTPTTITRYPPNTHTVHAQHKCGHPLGTPKPPPPKQPQPENPPF